MISVVVPFLGAFDKLKPTVEALIRNAKSKDWELVLFDNGSDEPFDYKKYAYKVSVTYVRNERNLGVLPSFKMALPYTRGDLVMYMHSDVLIHGQNWVARIEDAFAKDEELGLLGLFGARGIGVDGGRSHSISNMSGQKWGKCECHEVAAWHHGERITGVQPAAILDGVGMIFKRQTILDIINKTDSFKPWRAPHHFYDKILSLKTITLGYHVAVIDLEFDHWSGATANHSKKYDDFAKEWAKKFDYYIEGEDGDRMVYLAAEEQMFEEYAPRLPMNVVGDYHYEWNRQ